MTMNSITSRQRHQYNRFTQDGARKALTTVDPDKDGLQRLFGRGDEWQDYLIAGVRRFTAKTPNYSLAESILGADFITPEEVAKARTSIVYTDEETHKLVESLPSEDALKWCKDNGYAVIPAPPTAMSMLDVREMESFHFYTKTGGWYADQKYAGEDRTSQGWLAIKKTFVSNSTSKNWSEQNKLLSALEKVPNAALMSWFITTYFEVRGARLFESVYVRTSSLDSGGDRVCVGNFDAWGLSVNGYWRGCRDGSLGLSAGRKF